MLADWCLRMFAVLELAHRGPDGKNSAWYLVTALFIAPAVLFAPLNGAISNGLPKRSVLAGSAVFCLLALTVLAVWGQTGDPTSLLLCLLFVAVGAAIYGPTRYALLPAVAQDTGLPLPRVNGWIELGAAVAIIGGVIVAVLMDGIQWLGRPATLLLALGLGVLSAATAMATRFPSDVRRPERPMQAVRGFFLDALRIWRAPPARYSALALAALLALITAGSGAVVMHALSPETAGERALPIQALLFVSAGAAAGSWLAGRAGDAQRALGLVPVGAAGLLLALGAAALVPVDRPGLSGVACLFLGVMSGLANVPLRAALQAAVPADARGNAMAVTSLFIYVFTTLLSLVMVGLARLPIFDAPWKQMVLLAVLAGIGAAAASWAVGRETAALMRSLVGSGMEKPGASGVEVYCGGERATDEHG